MPNVITRDREACTDCGICAAHCPQMVFEKIDGSVEISHPDRCFGCFACEDDCPHDAIHVHRLPDGMSVDEIPAPGEGLDSDTVYDLAIIGAGPAGLGAAIRGRALGLNVAVIERLPSHERSHHPDGGLIVSVDDIYPLVDSDDGIYIEGIDVQLEKEIVVGRVHDFYFMGPSGQRTAASEGAGLSFPLVKKDGLVKRLAETARERGAVISYNTRAREIGDPADDGTRRVTFDDGKTIAARVVISAEGIGGALTHSAGVPVNEKREGWAVSPYGSLPPLESPRNSAGFLIGSGPGREGEVPYLCYVSSDGQATHVAGGPLQRNRSRVIDEPAAEVARRLAQEDGRLVAYLGKDIGVENATFDGCRVLLRPTPGAFVADALIAVGDAIATCGMMTSMAAMKTGDLAAQVVRDAVTAGDTSRATLKAYENRVRKLSLIQGMEWMHNILIRAPMELPRDELDELSDKLSKLALGRVQAGSMWPMVTFYLRMLPAIIFDRNFRKYLLP